jgi:uncharacterized protein YneF (UPF0154 family)
MQRAVLPLTYSLVAWVCTGMVAGIYLRSGDPVWSTTLEAVRWKYDLFGGSLAAYALLITVGLFRRAEWARILAISLCYTIAFVYLGMPIFAAWYAQVSIATVLHIEGLAVGTLAGTAGVMLARKVFRDYYSANPRLQRTALRAAAEPPGR